MSYSDPNELSSLTSVAAQPGWYLVEGVFEGYTIDGLNYVPIVAWAVGLCGTPGMAGLERDILPICANPYANTDDEDHVFLSPDGVYFFHSGVQLRDEAEALRMIGKLDEVDRYRDKVRADKARAASSAA